MQLKRSELHWVKALNKRSLQESLDLIIRYIADLDSYKERTLIATEELTTFLSARTDRNLYILSIISMIFLPLGFLTGLLGINVGGIPGADNDMAFGAFLAILGGLVVLQIFVLKLLKWV
jgi:zinc transporter